MAMIREDRVVSPRHEKLRCTCGRAVRLAVYGVSALFLLSSDCAGQQPAPVGLGNWLTLSTNLDAGYRQTQFFEPNHDAALFQWDGKLEVWLPPVQEQFSWGPYVRLTGITSSGGQAWENAWLGGPGVGFQIYPASAPQLRPSNSVAGSMLGPIRLFAEYNFVDYWGPENTWRPKRQARAGADYWKAVNVNTLDRAWWTEVYNAAAWQSSNEFTSQYDSVVVGNAVRIGVRLPHAAAMSAISPYVAAESSWTKNADYYWENHLIAGGGVRFAPSIMPAVGDTSAWISRLVVYAEYLDTVRYYGAVPGATVPRYDLRFGISTNMGRWYR
jgi:hypothetical protein